MKKRLFALALLSCTFLGAAGAAQGPDPELGPDAAIFDRLSGAWHVGYVFLAKDGTKTQAEGDFNCDWVMEGRVQQCVYTIDRSAEHREKYIGTSLNYFGAKSKGWRHTYIDPEVDAVLTLSGGPVGDDRIVLTTEEKDGKMTRWSFNDIRADSFIYRDETSHDGGKSWRLNEENLMARRAGKARS